MHSYDQLERDRIKYKVYRALLTQTGTDDPTATPLENGLSGPIVWARTDVGVYIATLTGAFLATKTFLSPVPGLYYDTHTSFVRTSDNVLTLTTTNDSLAPTDALLTGASVEILVYP